MVWLLELFQALEPLCTHLRNGVCAAPLPRGGKCDGAWKAIACETITAAVAVAQRQVGRKKMGTREGKTMSEKNLLGGSLYKAHIPPLKPIQVSLDG